MAMVPNFFTNPGWIAVILATIALLPQVVRLGSWLRTRWQTRHIPRNTQAHRDRANYTLLLQKYESYLILLENLIILRSQVEAGSEPWTIELEQQFVQTRDHIYNSLEERSKKESSMGVFQLLDILEGRMVGIAEERRKRENLHDRQAEIENHRLFIERDYSDE